jgi:2-dehydro-3-deoxygalactonokinase
MISYLSCDWGTSAFRLSLVDAENYNVIESEHSDRGILATYNNWNANNNTGGAERVSFYLDVIGHHINAIERKIGRSLDGVPLLISGMASSSIGMKPLPYHQLPFSIEGTGLLSEFIPQTMSFKHDVLLISGVRTEDDVMRGEETQLIGIFSGDAAMKGEKIYILPGTHSKHILVKETQAVDFKTFMTGEFFDLLSKKSILHAGLESGAGLPDGNEKKCFEEGVLEGAHSNLLKVCFKVRTNSLFERMTKKENYHYLSGLLIGAELGEIVRNDAIGIYLCGSVHLKGYYETALKVLGLKNVHSFSPQVVEKAAMIGQYKIYEKHIKR